MIERFRTCTNWGRGAGLAALLGIGLSVGSCGLPALTGSPFGGGGGADANVGVTSGGVQDIAAARARIEAGGAPDPESITIEGFMSEHDIPGPPPTDAQEFYASATLAWRQPFGEPAPMADAFVALGTTIPLDSFRRGPLRLALVVDRSGSMNDMAASGDYRRKLDAVKQALHALVDRLTADDQVVLVSFNDKPRLDLGTKSGDDRETIGAAIDALKPRGATNIMDALQLGFDQLAADAGGRARRIILFTDAQPNVGPTGSAEFTARLEEFAAAGVEFTLMGIGYDFNEELGRQIARVRGGNSFFLADAERIATIFDQDFDFLVMPAAYDLVLDVAVPDGVGIRGVYGVPDYEPGKSGARIRIPTMFLSRREGGGAIVVRFTLATTSAFAEPVPLGRLDLSYILRDGTPRQSGFDLTLPAGLASSGDPAYFSDPAAQRAALLLDTALVLRAATAAAGQGRWDDARQTLANFLPYFDQHSVGLSDNTDPSSRSLSQERALIEQLLGNVVRFTDSYYGGYYGP